MLSHSLTFTTFPPVSLPLYPLSHFGNATGVHTYGALYLLIIYGFFLLTSFFFSFALCRHVMKRICLTHAPCVHSTSMYLPLYYLLHFLLTRAHFQDSARNPGREGCYTIGRQRAKTLIKHINPTKHRKDTTT